MASAASPQVTLRYRSGTVELRGLAPDDAIAAIGECRWDKRSACFRMPAIDYAAAILALRRAGVAYLDEARDYQELARGLTLERDPRPYQAEALAAWERSAGRALVVLPTGAGKSHLALMAIDRKRRSTLVVAPTLDLVRQWYDLLRLHFDMEVGVVGGGEHRICPLTVTTYDSAYLHMEHLGARFGMMVLDECHHLPGESFALAADGCIAPYRLGLTATPERSDGRHVLLDRLVGPCCFRRDIVDLSGDYLADYDTLRIAVTLNEEERVGYETARATYLTFLRQHKISMGRADGWRTFIMRASQSSEGRRALLAHRQQRQLAFAASAKIAWVDKLLGQHRNDKILLFTQDNATAYRISRQFLIPAITHQTKVSERSEILMGLRQGRFGAIVTSKVLNEGVDVPEANVAIVVSGSASVREHVQRLGRILRKLGDKRALLYELVTKETSETFTSEQRREHSAYR